MAELIFVGRTDDNTRLLLADPDGNEFTVPIDDFLLTSVRASSATMADGPLGVSPRDIQARIRRGETAGAIAAEAGVPVERVERYAGPVYTERWHMAQRARGAHIRRGDTTLDQGVSVVLGSLGVDNADLDWDSWRREDARWNVSVAWTSGQGTGAATWIFDPHGQTLVPLDDEAKWISDESLAPGAPPSLSTEHRPRLVAVPDTVMPEPAPYDPPTLDELEPPAWAGPGHPTMPVSLDDDPSWDDILFGSRPSDS